MKLSQFYFIALIFILMVSCNSNLVPSKIKRNFTTCYNGEYIRLDTIININGFYRAFSERDGWGENAVYEHRIDTNEVYFFLSSDGMFFYNININEKYRRDRNMSFPYPSHGKGCFVINRDTIIAQWIAKYTQTNFTAWEDRYRVLDKNTLLFLGSKPLHKTSPLPATELERREHKERDFEQVFGRKRVVSDTATFIPLQVVPPSDCWLKKKKWFWCDKQEWKEYKKAKN